MSLYDRLHLREWELFNPRNALRIHFMKFTGRIREFTHIHETEAMLDVSHFGGKMYFNLPGLDGYKMAVAASSMTRDIVKDLQGSPINAHARQFINTAKFIDPKDYRDVSRVYFPRVYCGGKIILLTDDKRHLRIAPRFFWYRPSEYWRSTAGHRRLKLRSVELEIDKRFYQK